MEFCSTVYNFLHIDFIVFDLFTGPFQAHAKELVEYGLKNYPNEAILKLVTISKYN